MPPASWFSAPFARFAVHDPRDSPQSPPVCVRNAQAGKDRKGNLFLATPPNPTDPIQREVVDILCLLCVLCVLCGYRPPLYFYSLLSFDTIRKMS